MKNNLTYTERMANLVQAFSELTEQNLEEAREALITAGKDPDRILERGMQRLHKIQSETIYKLNKIRVSQLGINDKVGKSFYFTLNILVLNTASRTIYLKNSVETGEVLLTAEDIFNTVNKNQPLCGIDAQEVKEETEVKNLKLRSIQKELSIEIAINAKNAIISQYLNVNRSHILVSADYLTAISQTGYLIVKDELHVVSRESVEFAEKLLANSVDSNTISVGVALELFSRRHEMPWLKFSPAEFDLELILKSDEFSSYTSLFVRELYGYQKDGFKWLQYCCTNKIGGILGDDMGLGKTAQTIAMIAWIIEKNIFPNVLIVVPSTLIENWKREFNFFAPSITPYIHYGAYRGASIPILEQHRVIITSYSLIINDQYLFNKIQWGLILLDEASLIKNPLSERRIALKDIPSQVRVAMTGTPVENSLRDLWSISDYVNPGYLGSIKEFESKYIRSSIEATLADSNLYEIKKDISHIMLRRKKEDVLDSLPEKIDIHQALQMQNDEAVLYEQKRESIMNLAKRSSGGYILSMIQELRQFTTHPFLLQSERIQHSRLSDLMDGSVKFRRTKELLDEICARQDKVLIFTEYLNMIDAFKRVFSQHYNKEVFTIDGRVENTDRQKNIDKFSECEGFSIMILNPKTAGMGLNITAANHVIHYTRQWNPALEEQATARAYRNKQEKNVNVYYLYYVNTIEEAIYERLIAKKELAGEVVTSTSDENGIEEYIAALFKSPLKNK